MYKSGYRMYMRDVFFVPQNVFFGCQFWVVMYIMVHMVVRGVFQ